MNQWWESDDECVAFPRPVRFPPRRALANRTTECQVELTRSSTPCSDDDPFLYGDPSRPLAPTSDDETSSPHTVSSTDLVLLPPTIYGFSLSLREWGELLLSNFSPIAFRDDAWDRLVLDEQTKRLVKGLVECNEAVREARKRQKREGGGAGVNGTDAAKEKEVEVVSDIVEGKGGGLVRRRSSLSSPHPLLGGLHAGTLTSTDLAGHHAPRRTRHRQDAHGRSRRRDSPRPALHRRRRQPRRASRHPREAAARRPRHCAVLGRGAAHRRGACGSVLSFTRHLTEARADYKERTPLAQADVFLEARSLHDVARNAMVSVFLRLLEHHRGVLFLTTNRIRSIDPAFLSRFSLCVARDLSSANSSFGDARANRRPRCSHSAITYPNLDRKKRKVIWRQFLELARVGIDQGGDSSLPSPAATPPPHGTSPKSNGVSSDHSRFDSFLSPAYLSKLASNSSFNGRQIKNAVRTAQALALSQGEKLGQRQIEEVVKAVEDFKRDFEEADEAGVYEAPGEG